LCRGAPQGPHLRNQQEKPAFQSPPGLIARRRFIAEIRLKKPQLRLFAFVRKKGL
jgi:hypothetical protein